MHIFEISPVNSKKILDSIIVGLRGKNLIRYDVDFAKQLGYAPETISNLLAGRKQMGKVFMEKVSKTFHIRMEYLEAGELPMFKNEAGNVSDNAKHDKTQTKQHNTIAISNNDYITLHVPLVNKYAYGGYVRGWGDTEFMETLPTIPLLVTKEHKGQYLAFELRGDSMRNDSEDSLREGDVLFGREVPRDLWRDKLHIERWKRFIIVTDDGVMTKQIIKHDTKTGDITLHSLNPLYEDFVINLDNVRQLFNVVQVLREN